MAYAATCSDKGVTHRTNQDAVCVQVADTRLGEVAMVVVCDGVGGLDAGELASASVVGRLMRWFREELPAKVSYAAMGDDPALVVEHDWRVMLARLNAQMAEGIEALSLSILREDAKNSMSLGGICPARAVSCCPCRRRTHPQAGPREA